MKERSVQGACGARRTGRCRVTLLSLPPGAPSAATPPAPGMCGHHHPKLRCLLFHLLLVSSGMFPDSHHLSLPPLVWALIFSHPQTSTELPSDSRRLSLSHALLERGSCAPPPAGAAPSLFMGSWKAPHNYVCTDKMEGGWGTGKRRRSQRDDLCGAGAANANKGRKRRRKVTLAAWKIRA